MEWLSKDSLVSVFLYLAVLVELIGFTLVLVEGLRPKRARFIESWFGLQVNRKLFVTRVKEIFKLGQRRPPDLDWLVFFFIVIAFHKMIVWAFEDRLTFDGILLSFVRLLFFALVLVCGMVLCRIFADLTVRVIVWALERLRPVTHNRAVGGLGGLLLFAGIVMNVFQIVLRY